MAIKNKENNELPQYMENQDYLANLYVMKCYMVTMLVFTAAFVLNLLGIFIVEQKLMWRAYIPSLIIFVVVCIVSKVVSLSNRQLKYFILFSIISMFTIAGVFITYHVVLVSLFPFLYAALYSSKRVMGYVCILAVLSTIITAFSKW